MLVPPVKHLKFSAERTSIIWEHGVLEIRIQGSAARSALRRLVSC